MLGVYSSAAYVQFCMVNLKIVVQSLEENAYVSKIQVYFFNFQILRYIVMMCLRCFYVILIF